MMPGNSLHGNAGRDDTVMPGPAPAAMPPGDRGGTIDDSWLFGRAQVDLDGIKSALLRNRWVILSIALAAVLTGTAATLLTVPGYRAQSSIQIDLQSTRILASPDIEPIQAVEDSDRFLQTQLEILRSRALAARVAATLGLFADPGFLNASHVEPDRAMAAKLGMRAAVRERVIGVLQDNLKVTLPDGSRVVRIAFDSPDPVLAAKIANAFADAMISSNLSRRFDASAYARSFLREQLEQARERLESSEQSMIGYARQSGIIDTAAARQAAEGSAPQSLVAASLIQANDALAAARTRRIDAQEQWESVRRAPLMNLPDVLANPTVQSLMEKRAILEAQLADQDQRRRADHPDIVRVRSQIASFDLLVRQIGEDIRGSIASRYRTAALQEGQMQHDVDRLKSETLDEQDRGIRYNIFRREVQTNRELYDGLLQRFKEVSAAAGMSANNISIVDPAVVPMRPVSPNLISNVALSLLGGIILALGFVYVRENFDDLVRTVEDAERKLRLPALGMVPRLPGDAVFARELENRGSRLSEAFHSIRAAIELSRTGRPLRSLLVTSSQKGEGKTSITYALALELAQSGRRVLLIDADMRHPSMHRMLGVENGRGLMDVLEQSADHVDVVRPTTTAGLSFISAGVTGANPAALLASHRFPRLIRQVEDTYDLVLVDSPPVLGLADAPTMSAHVDGTLFVVNTTGARRGFISAALRRLRFAQPTLLGVVLSMVEFRTLGSEYAYYYQYDADAAPASRRWWNRR